MSAMRNLNLNVKRSIWPVSYLNKEIRLIANVKQQEEVIIDPKLCKRLFRILTIVLVVTVLTINQCIATGVDWKIFASGYTYNQGSVNLKKVIKTKNITDVIKAKDGTIWLACADNYPIFIKGINSADYSTGIFISKTLQTVQFKPSASSRFALLPNGDLWMVTHENILRLKNSA
jgi:hypothetical protein